MSQIETYNKPRWDKTTQNEPKEYLKWTKTSQNNSKQGQMCQKET